MLTDVEHYISYLELHCLSPQNGWFKTIEIDCFVVHGATSPKSDCIQSCVLSGGSRKRVLLIIW